MGAAPEGTFQVIRTFGDYEVLETLRSLEPRVLAFAASRRSSPRDLELRVTLDATEDPPPPRIAEILDRLRHFSHPHLVPIVDLGLDSGCIFHATELGCSLGLGEWLDSLPRAPDAEQVLDLLLPVAETLRHLHLMGVVHGDISLETIRLEKASERAFLGTLSLGRMVDPLSRPRARELLGHPRIEPPECEHGAPCDARSDVLLFATVLYQAITPRRFPAAPAEDGRSRDLLASLSPASCAGGGAPEAIDPVLARALAVEPGERFPSMGELIEALDPVRRGVRVRAILERGPAHLIHLKGIRKKRIQEMEEKGAASRSIPVPAPEPDPVSRFDRLSIPGKLTLFLVLVALSATLPLTELLSLAGSDPPASTSRPPRTRPDPRPADPVVPPVPGTGTSPATTTAAGTPAPARPVDPTPGTVRLSAGERALVELADSSWKDPTRPASFEARFRSLWSFGESQGGRDPPVLTARDLTELKKVFARDPDRASRDLDDLIRRCRGTLPSGQP